MAVSYSNLFVPLIDKKMKEENLFERAGVSPSTMRKMGCGETAAMNTDFCFPKIPDTGSEIFLFKQRTRS